MLTNYHTAQGTQYQRMSSEKKNTNASKLRMTNNSQNRGSKNASKTNQPHPSKNYVSAQQLQIANKLLD